ncbi:ABC transporter permease [Phytoactinopolyspora limicola]|uniref:ABC transporter permease n=1 Tax=Phytoactinopolyspora limicola TaxID=2715536 RepID=UPI0014096BC0|nr:ABC transporter permease subunit [Phytoactinopolyspora limicola]
MSKLATGLARRGDEVWRQRVQRSARRLPPVEMVVAICVGLIVWTIVAARTEDYILPPITDVGSRIVELFTDADQRWDWLMTMFRIMLGLITSFVVGTALGLAMGRSRRLTNIFMPYLQITQGIPSLSWVMIAIIWFQTVEVRIWFLMVMVTLAGFAFQAQDSYRAIPAELKDMAKSLRPRRDRLDMFRTITLPAILPGMLTAWKVNLGLGTRVVLIAEFAGATIGVGYQLRLEQQFFRMDGVIAWTASLVIFVLIIQQVIAMIERRMLRYRPGAHMPQVSEATQEPLTAQPDARQVG